MTAMPLAGLLVLVVEDHYFVATELTRVLRQLGAAVVGPVARLPLDPALADRAFDVALLDVQLGEGTSLPLADEMARRGVPVGLITGYGVDGLPTPYRRFLHLDKPVERNTLMAAVLQLCGRNEGLAA